MSFASKLVDHSKRVVTDASGMQWHVRRVTSAALVAAHRAGLSMIDPGQIASIIAAKHGAEESGKSLEEVALANLNITADQMATMAEKMADSDGALVAAGLFEGRHSEDEDWEVLRVVPSFSRVDPSNGLIHITHIPGPTLKLLVAAIKALGSEDGEAAIRVATFRDGPEGRDNGGRYSEQSVDAGERSA